MARRSRPRKEPKKPFDEASAYIAVWERRVCYSTVTPEFNLTDVVNWLYPADALQVLRAAFSLTSEAHPDRTERINLNVPDIGDISRDGGGIVRVELRLDCDDAKICTPRQGLALQQEDRHGIVRAILDYAHVVQEWNVVRDVVDWLNDNATPACARYYFPALGNFLPSDHAFHQSGGTRYAEPRQSIGLIAHKVRRAAETVTMALHCPHSENTKENTGCYLTILDQNDIHSTTKQSQTFFL